MENFRQFMINASFFLVTSVCLVLFVLLYPPLNGFESVLNNDPSINENMNNLTGQFKTYPTAGNLEKDVLTADIPEVGSESIQLTSTVSNTRTQWSRIITSIKILYIMVANTLGMSAGTLGILLGVLSALMTAIVGLLVWKNVRTGD